MTKYTFTDLSLNNTNGKYNGTANLISNTTSFHSNTTYTFTATGGANNTLYNFGTFTGENGIIRISVPLKSALYDLAKPFKDDITGLTIDVDTSSGGSISVTGSSKNEDIKLAIFGVLRKYKINLTSIHISSKPS